MIVTKQVQIAEVIMHDGARKTHCIGVIAGEPCSNKAHWQARELNRSTLYPLCGAHAMNARKTGRIHVVTDSERKS